MSSDAALIPDRYEQLYRERLWSLIPAVYRASDTESLDTPGPVWELVARIAAQAAILRRSLDRLWADQYIETCDDALIPYIGDLLATKLVPGLSPRGQRLDVAHTIHYRRRKGTVAVLEEVATDMTDWEVRVVEFFRRISRARHNLDPAIGTAPTRDSGLVDLRKVEGIVGTRTGTPLGGFADIRHPDAALQSTGAFDEFSHLVDVRRGVGHLGWYDIPRLGAFVWRLASFHVIRSTPVEALPACPRHFTFDPTGRERPLFAFRSRTDLSSAWKPLEPWQAPGPISRPLVEVDLAGSSNLRPESIEVEQDVALPQGPTPIPWPKQVDFYPERGRFVVDAAVTPPFLASYCYGFSSMVGAGPYDRRVTGEQLAASVGAPQPVVTGGGNALNAALAVVPASFSITIGDSRTYTQIANVGTVANPTGDFVIRSSNAPPQRPLIRLPGADWVITGDPNTNVWLEGLFISGGDVILRGEFNSVTITCCTFDPGDSGLDRDHPTIYLQSVDGRDLLPSRLVIEGVVKNLTIHRCILGGVYTRADTSGQAPHGATGKVEEVLTIQDSVLQAIRMSDPTVQFAAGDIKDEPALAARFDKPADPLTVKLKSLIETDLGHPLSSPPTASQLYDGFNALRTGPLLYTSAPFGDVALSSQTFAMATANPLVEPTSLINRLLLEDAYPQELLDAAISVPTGRVHLYRCTVMSPAFVHRLEASECLLTAHVVVDDTQDGCVRFSACADKSVLPRQFETNTVPQDAAIFVSTRFADPGYAQLGAWADLVAMQSAPSLLSGGPEGSELGAFALDKNPIKERAIVIKFQEFMPLGLSPVIVHVT